jgi:alpha-beta hydrolase superfamily lysophospholipase
MPAFKKLIPLIAASFLMAAPSAFAECSYENQSDIGKLLRIPVHHWSDSAVDTKAIVVAIPGLVFNGRAYDAIASQLASHGYEVYSADMRGYGDWRKNKGEFDGDNLVHFGQTKTDLTRLLTVLRKNYANKPIFLLGESFGAGYAVWEACTDPQLMDGIIASGPAYRICVHPRPRWLLTVAQGLKSPKKPMKLEPYLVPTLSEDKEVTLTALRDRDIILAELSATDLIKALITTKQAFKQVADIPENMPILLIAGQKDAIQKTNRLPELTSTIGSKQTQLVVLPKRGHLLFEQKVVDPELMRLVQDWLDKQVQRYGAERTSASAGETPAAIARQ